MMNAQDKELAAECGLVEEEPLYLPVVLNFAHRYYLAKLEQDPEVQVLREEVERLKDSVAVMDSAGQKQAQNCWPYLAPESSVDK